MPKAFSKSKIKTKDTEIYYEKNKNNFALCYFNNASLSLL
jgi:hypothetical protein